MSARSKTGARAPQRAPGRTGAARRGGFSINPVAVVWLLVAVTLVGLIGLFVASPRARGFAQGFATQLGSQAVSAGFGVRHVVVQGAGPQARAAIAAAVGVRPGQPLTNVDLAAVRGRVEAIRSLSHVRVVRLLPDTLVVSVTERPRLAVWQHEGRLSVIDAEGGVIGEADPAASPNLPLVVGPGAETSAAEMMELMRAHARVAGLTAALVRVDERRWDLRLRDGGVVMLPAADAGAALARLDELDHATRLLELGFTRIDLRNADTIAVRPRGDAAHATPTRPAAAPTPPAADVAADEH